jgi:hypothetical protein
MDRPKREVITADLGDLERKVIDLQKKSLIKFQKAQVTKPTLPPLSPTVILAFDAAELLAYKGKLPELSNAIDATKVLGFRATEIKATIGRFGEPQLILQVYPDSFHMWNYRTGATFGDYTDVPDNLVEIADRVYRDQHFCPTCNNWFPKSFMRSYSFAGTVCQNCFDPKKHLPPDTRGD